MSRDYFPVSLDVIFTSDLVDSRIISLENDKRYLEEALETAKKEEHLNEQAVYAAEINLDGWYIDNEEEYDLIVAFKREMGSNWKEDLEFIPDRQFQDYTYELGMQFIPRGIQERWPVSCIDWDRAAKELQTEFSAVEFRGETYWYQ